MQFPTWLEWYKKPSYVDVNEYANALSQRAGTGSRTPSPVGHARRPSADVPSKLALERIMKNRTCSPMSLYDFYMYLKHIEHSAENLEFYVWFKNYEAGRLTAFPEMPKAPTPLHDQDDVQPYVRAHNGSEASLKKAESIDDKMSQATTAEVEAQEMRYNFEDFEIYGHISELVSPGSGCGTKACAPKRRGSMPKEPFAISHRIVEGNLELAIPKSSSEMQSAQRAELDTIKTLFLLPNSPKELNIPAPMRIKVLRALESSTEAENLAPVAEHCWLLLKSCSHRNFVRLGVSNGTFETLCMATSLGIVLTVGGFLCMLLLALETPSFRRASRWQGLGVWPMWGVGVSLILSGLRGSCFFLLLFSRRQPLPWEGFDEEQRVAAPRSPVVRFLSKLMIFDRKLKVKDDGLRRLQRKVVVQSLIGGFGFATVMVVVFLCLPIWKHI